jgi:hypothetical protein
MLAPLLLGSGMLLRSVRSNASYVIPRMGLMVVLLWVIWFVNSVIQNTWAILRNQGRLDARMAAALVTLTECITLLLAGIVVLSMIGINISGLLVPAGICVAIASKDLLQNLLAGFFLFIVQPFRIGDTVAVTTGLPALQRRSLVAEMGGPGEVPGPGAGWFEGTCEKVDLRWGARGGGQGGGAGGAGGEGRGATEWRGAGGLGCRSGLPAGAGDVSCLPMALGHLRLAGWLAGWLAG